MRWVLAILAMLFCFMLIVGIHELGHALVAQWFGVKIRKINLGFGQPILSFRGWKKRRWILRLWPIGGSVELLSTRIHKMSPSLLEHSFEQKPIRMRALILLAGSAANLIAAWFVLFVYFFIKSRLFFVFVMTYII